MSPLIGWLFASLNPILRLSLWLAIIVPLERLVSVNPHNILKGDRHRSIVSHHFLRDAWPASYGIQAKVPDSLVGRLAYSLRVELPRRPAINLSETAAANG